MMWTFMRLAIVILTIRLFAVSVAGSLREGKRDHLSLRDVLRRLHKEPFLSAIITLAVLLIIAASFLWHVVK